MISNLMAILLQAMSLRLGIASGRDLAQACRDSYSRPVALALWVLAELAKQHRWLNTDAAREPPDSFGLWGEIFDSIYRLQDRFPLISVPVYFISGDPIKASGSVYSSNSKLDAEKYVFFSLAALELPRHLNWTPDILHTNDWHTALAAYGNLVKRWEDRKNRIASIVTIHNLPFMGPDVREILESYGLPLANTDLPDWARIMPVPLGLWASDGIVAVSPTYADEILHEEFGSALQDFFRNRTDSLSGILNGIDSASFDPKTDPANESNFDAEALPARKPNKAALQERLSLPAKLESNQMHLGAFASWHGAVTLRRYRAFIWYVLLAYQIRAADEPPCTLPSPSLSCSL